MRVSKSRNVCGYVKAVRKWQKLSREATLAQVDMNQRRGKLTGAQTAEAARILSGQEVAVDPK